MEKDYGVSIIVPMYNAESYISDTLDGLLNQTYKDFEVIVIDDCSKDSGAEIVENYVKTSDRIKLLKNEQNMGVAKTRNKGIQHAKHSWIAFCDADDVWVAEKLEKQIDLIKNRGVRLCFTGIRFMTNDGQELDRTFKVPEKVNYKKLLKQNVITLSSAILPKEMGLKHPMHSDNCHEDYIFWLTILKSDIDFAYGINEPLVLYRKAKNSKTHNKLKALKMTYKTYRKVGINPFSSLYYTFVNCLKWLKKHKL